MSGETDPQHKPAPVATRDLKMESSAAQEEKRSEHTITGRMAALFIDSKLTVIVMIAALLFGIWAILTTPREENPQITMPAAASLP